MKPSFLFPSGVLCLLWGPSLSVLAPVGQVCHSSSFHEMAPDSGDIASSVGPLALSVVESFQCC